MTFLKQLGIVLGVTVLLFFGTPMVYAIATAIGGDADIGNEAVAVIGIVLAMLWLAGGIIYLAVSAALRSRN